MTLPLVISPPVYSRYFSIHLCKVTNHYPNILLFDRLFHPTLNLNPIWSCLTTNKNKINLSGMMAAPKHKHSRNES